MVVVVSLVAVVGPMMAVGVVADSDGSEGGIVVTAYSILSW